MASPKKLLLILKQRLLAYLFMSSNFRASKIISGQVKVMITSPAGLMTFFLNVEPRNTTNEMNKYRKHFDLIIKVKRRNHDMILSSLCKYFYIR